MMDSSQLSIVTVLLFIFFAFSVIGLLVVATMRANKERKEMEQQIEEAKLQRIDAIETIAREAAWEPKFKSAVIRGQIMLGMSEQMVLIAWGEPTTIEEKSRTQRGVKTRWIYGTSRHKGVQYLWFQDGIVNKIGN